MSDEDDSSVSAAIALRNRTDSEAVEDAEGRQQSYERLMARQTKFAREQREKRRAELREARMAIAQTRAQRGVVNALAEAEEADGETEAERRHRLRRVYAAERRGWTTKTSSLEAFLGKKPVEAGDDEEEPAAELAGSSAPASPRRRRRMSVEAEQDSALERDRATPGGPDDSMPLLSGSSLRALEKIMLERQRLEASLSGDSGGSFVDGLARAAGKSVSGDLDAEAEEEEEDTAVGDSSASEDDTPAAVEDGTAGQVEEEEEETAAAATATAAAGPQAKEKTKKKKKAKKKTKKKATTAPAEASPRKRKVKTKPAVPKSPRKKKKKKKATTSSSSSSSFMQPTRASSLKGASGSLDGGGSARRARSQGLGSARGDAAGAPAKKKKKLKRSKSTKPPRSARGHDASGPSQQPPPGLRMAGGSSYARLPDSARARASSGAGVDAPPRFSAGGRGTDRFHSIGGRALSNDFLWRTATLDRPLRREDVHAVREDVVRYFALPGPLGERVYRVFDPNDRGYIMSGGVSTTPDGGDGPTGEERVGALMAMRDANCDETMSRGDVVTLVHAMVTLHAMDRDVDRWSGMSLADLERVRSRARDLVDRAHEEGVGGATADGSSLSVPAFQAWLGEDDDAQARFEAIFEAIDEAAAAAAADGSTASGGRDEQPAAARSTRVTRRPRAQSDAMATPRRGSGGGGRSSARGRAMSGSLMAPTVSSMAKMRNQSDLARSLQASYEEKTADVEADQKDEEEEAAWEQRRASTGQIATPRSARGPGFTPRASAGAGGSRARGIPTIVEERELVNMTEEELRDLLERSRAEYAREVDERLSEQIAGLERRLRAENAAAVAAARAEAAEELRARVGEQPHSSQLEVDGDEDVFAAFGADEDDRGLDGHESKQAGGEPSRAGDATDAESSALDWTTDEDLWPSDAETPRRPAAPVTSVQPRLGVIRHLGSRAASGSFSGGGLVPGLDLSSLVPAVHLPGFNGAQQPGELGAGSGSDTSGVSTPAKPKASAAPAAAAAAAAGQPRSIGDMTWQEFAAFQQHTYAQTLASQQMDLQREIARATQEGIDQIKNAARVRTGGAQPGGEPDIDDAGIGEAGDDDMQHMRREIVMKSASTAAGASTRPDRHGYCSTRSCTGAGDDACVIL